MGYGACTSMICNLKGESSHGWQYNNRMLCRDCEKSFSPKNIKYTKTGRAQCPCCGQFLMRTPRSLKAKKFLEQKTNNFIRF